MLNKQVCPKTGIIKADVVWNGIAKQKTLFPSYWTREQVIEKILEAFKNQISLKQNPNKTFELIGETKKGIRILICINERGKIMTAYPIFKV